MTPHMLPGPFGQTRATRREALALAASAGLAAVLGAASGAQAQGAPGEDPLASLGALLDTFLPDDGLSPAATAVGVDRELRQFLAQSGPLGPLFAAALAWMDGLGPVPFAQLPPADRQDILTAMSQADVNQIPGRFYHIARALAVEYYYARAEALAGLALNPSPQPEGYPPPWT